MYATSKNKIYVLMWTNVFSFISRNLRANLRRQIAACLSIFCENRYTTMSKRWFDSEKLERPFNTFVVRSFISHVFITSSNTANAKIDRDVSISVMFLLDNWTTLTFNFLRIKRQRDPRSQYLPSKFKGRYESRESSFDLGKQDEILGTARSSFTRTSAFPEKLAKICLIYICI